MRIRALHNQQILGSSCYTVNYIQASSMLQKNNPWQMSRLQNASQNRFWKFSNGCALSLSTHTHTNSPLRTSHCEQPQEMTDCQSALSQVRFTTTIISAPHMLATISHPWWSWGFHSLSEGNLPWVARPPQISFSPHICPGTPNSCFTFEKSNVSHKKINKFFFFSYSNVLQSKIPSVQKTEH